MAKNDMIAVSVLFVRETDAAILVDDAGNEVWLPKSQIEFPDDAKLDDVIDVSLPEWLAEDKELI